MAQVIACVRWRSNTTGQHYCEYYDKTTGGFLSIGIALNPQLAERRAASKLPTAVTRALPNLSLSPSLPAVGGP